MFSIEIPLVLSVLRSILNYCKADFFSPVFWFCGPPDSASNILSFIHSSKTFILTVLGIFIFFTGDLSTLRLRGSSIDLWFYLGEVKLSLIYYRSNTFIFPDYVYIFKLRDGWVGSGGLSFFFSYIFSLTVWLKCNIFYLDERDLPLYGFLAEPSRGSF